MVGFRWTARQDVLLLLCAMYFLTYIDRGAVSTAAGARPRGGRRVPGRDRTGARGRPQHHDVDEGDGPSRPPAAALAGAFGYQAASRAMGEAALAPAVRAAAPHDLVVADGTSCRHQIRDLTGRAARHTAQLVAQALP